MGLGVSYFPICCVEFVGSSTFFFFSFVVVLVVLIFVAVVAVVRRDWLNSMVFLLLHHRFMSLSNFSAKAAAEGQPTAHAKDTAHLQRNGRWMGP